MGQGASKKNHKGCKKKAKNKKVVPRLPAKTYGHTCLQLTCFYIVKPAELSFMIWAASNFTFGKARDSIAVNRNIVGLLGRFLHVRLNPANCNKQ